MAEDINILRPTVVLLFGNPKAGTVLMQKDASLASALPLKATIWKGSEGLVWVSYPDLIKVAKDHNYKGDMMQVKKMYLGLTSLMLKATTG